MPKLHLDELPLAQLARRPALPNPYSNGQGPRRTGLTTGESGGEGRIAGAQTTRVAGGQKMFTFGVNSEAKISLPHSAREARDTPAQNRSGIVLATGKNGMQTNAMQRHLLQAIAGNTLQSKLKPLGDPGVHPLSKGLASGFGSENSSHSSRVMRIGKEVSDLHPLTEGSAETNLHSAKEHPHCSGDPPHFAARSEGNRILLSARQHTHSARDSPRSALRDKGNRTLLDARQHPSNTSTKDSEKSAVQDMDSRAAQTDLQSKTPDFISHQHEHTVKQFQKIQHSSDEDFLVSSDGSSLPIPDVATSRQDAGTNHAREAMSTDAGSSADQTLASASAGTQQTAPALAGDFDQESAPQTVRKGSHLECLGQEIDAKRQKSCVTPDSRANSNASCQSDSLDSTVREIKNAHLRDNDASFQRDATCSEVHPHREAPLSSLVDRDKDTHSRHFWPGKFDSAVDPSASVGLVSLPGALASRQEAHDSKSCQPAQIPKSTYTSIELRFSDIGFRYSHAECTSRAYHDQRFAHLHSGMAYTGSGPSNNAVHKKMAHQQGVASGGRFSNQILQGHMTGHGSQQSSSHQPTDLKQWYKFDT